MAFADCTRKNDDHKGVNQVQIRDGRTGYRSQYLHLANVAGTPSCLVSLGMPLIGSGTPLATIDNTGNSSGDCALATCAAVPGVVGTYFLDALAAFTSAGFTNREVGPAREIPLSSCQGDNGESLDGLVVFQRPEEGRLWPVFAPFSIQPIICTLPPEPTPTPIPF